MDDAFQIAQDVVVPEADDAPALRFEVAGSGFVIGSAFVMLSAINLDDQLFRPGGEIRDVRADRDLPVEADACDLASR
ncbi:hypothetical protein GGR45_001052 [Sphingomonas zeae]|nr:hypothetical protein [Sphingomonas zeae]